MYMCCMQAVIDRVDDSRFVLENNNFREMEENFNHSGLVCRHKPLSVVFRKSGSEQPVL